MDVTSNHQLHATADSPASREAVRLGLGAFVALSASGAAFGGVLPAENPQKSSHTCSSTVVENFGGQSAGNLASLRTRAVQTLSTEGIATALAWSKNGETVATASDFGRSLILWNAQGQRTAQFRRDISYVGNSLAFMADGHSLLTPTATDKPGESAFAMSVIDAEGSRVSYEVAGPAPGRPVQYNRAVAFAPSPDGEKVAAITSMLPNQPVTLYGVRNGQGWARLASLPMPNNDGALSLAFAPDGQHLAIGTTQGRILLFDLAEPGRQPAVTAAYQAPPTIGVESLAFSPDGTMLASGGGMLIGLKPEAGNTATAPVKLWRTKDLSLAAAHEGDFYPVRALSFGNANVLAAAGGDRTLRLFQNDKALPPVTYDQPVTAARFAPDGQRLALASGDAVHILTISP